MFPHFRGLIIGLGILFVSGYLCPAAAQNRWQEHFDACQVEGSITLYHDATQQWTFSDAEDAITPSLPASTFKIPNSLIILEEGLITNPDAPMPWNQQTDTAKYGYRPDIYQALSLRQAYKKSAVWFYLEMAHQLPRARYQDWLAKCGYGNGDLRWPEEDFWNFGPLGVTPRQQINFLVGVQEETLPFSVEHLHTLKDIMAEEWNDHYVLRAKTGWTRQEGEYIGWWVGYVERKDAGDVWYFATRIRQKTSEDTSRFGACRKEITRAILAEVGALKEE